MEIIPLELWYLIAQFSQEKRTLRLLSKGIKKIVDKTAGKVRREHIILKLQGQTKSLTVPIWTFILGYLDMEDALMFLYSYNFKMFKVLMSWDFKGKTVTFDDLRRKQYFFIMGRKDIRKKLEFLLNGMELRDIKDVMYNMNLEIFDLLVDFNKNGECLNVVSLFNILVGISEDQNKMFKILLDKRKPSIDLIKVCINEIREHATLRLFLEYEDLNGNRITDDEIADLYNESVRIRDSWIADFLNGFLLERSRV